MADFEYYYGSEAEQFNFFRLPKKLIRDKQFKRISSEAKILYGIMLDRMALSVRNGWIDSENRVYIICTVADVAEEFCCSERKAKMLMSELDTIHGIGLIEKKRQGLGKPNLIYVKNFNSIGTVKAFGQGEEQALPVHTYTADQETDEPEEQFEREEAIAEGKVQPVQRCKNLHVKKCKDMHVQRCKNLHVKKCKNMHPNNTDNSETNYNNINNPSIYPSYYSVPLSEEGWMDRKAIMNMFMSRLEYGSLCIDYPNEQERIEELFRLLTDVCCCKSNSVAIGGNSVPIQQVRAQFLTLTNSHIRYVLYALEQNTTQVKNIRAYLLACLYNAPATMHSFYHSQVQSDMYG